MSESKYRMPSNSENNKRRELITLVVVFAGVLLVSALAVYFLGRGRSTPTQRQTETVEEVRQPGDRTSPIPQQTDDENFIDRLFGSRLDQTHLTNRRWAESVGQISLRLLLAALLGSALAFRPRKRILGLRRNPYVAQTQILLAIVAAALMIIVGDNAARAFGIFAAVSLVRFRTNIRDPKEITVLLISLALGLAAGVGRWDLALILVGFVLCVLWLLEWREPQLVFRSMEMKVTTRNVASTKRALRQVFTKHGFESELRAVDRNATEESPGTIIYSVDLSPTVTTDQLSEEIFGLDKQNIESIEWDQKKSFSYLYR
jgi:uncharacterized membrane protein YhiD involved in acid resistance